VLAAKLYDRDPSARPLARINRLSSGWPTSIQCTIWPVRSLCQSAGSSTSHRSFASSSAPWSVVCRQVQREREQPDHHALVGFRRVRAIVTAWST
jgi:hypothetical protein